MQIVIEIDKDAYEALCGTGYVRSNFNMIRAVRESTPLPEHHGRLADLDAALKCVEEVTDSKEKEYAIAIFDWAMSKRVIIPATEEGE